MNRDQQTKPLPLDLEEPVNDWFELSYAQYLTIPRSALQSMPVEWQRRFVECLEQLDEAIDWRPSEGRYWVKLKNNLGKYVTDPLMDYRHVRLPYKGYQTGNVEHLFDELKRRAPIDLKILKAVVERYKFRDDEWLKANVGKLCKFTVNGQYAEGILDFSVQMNEYCLPFFGGHVNATIALIAEP